VGLASDVIENPRDNRIALDQLAGLTINPALPQTAEGERMLIFEGQ
jgi:hypothetical protein